VTNWDVGVNHGRPLGIVHLSSIPLPFEQFLTIRIGWVQLQRLQGLCTRTQMELYAPHSEEIHATETEPAGKINHVLH